MIVREVYAKSVLSKSKVLDYVVNPYVGCEHGCAYCYARYVKRFTGYMEPWGEFVDVKINAPTLLQQETRRKKVGRVWVSGLCDPYQPLEKRYNLTRKCLEILLKRGWPVTIQTKSTLVLRDIDLIKGYGNVEVTLTITTADEGIRQIFEPKAPSIRERLEVLEKLHSAGVKTCVMIAPLLPKAEGLVREVVGKTDYVLVDKMNYHYADWIYRRHHLEHAMTSKFFRQKKKEIAKLLEKEGIPYKFEF
ncbi:MAG: radical SAM protein [Candidatus Bathyarchaeota archaeon]|nr:radical SAM protein [Candidatus Bathyarchaeota archaeon]MDW8040485.1 radical SAM protein [Nitrososphaerota archaeon]